MARNSRQTHQNFGGFLSSNTKYLSLARKMLYQEDCTEFFLGQRDIVYVSMFNILAHCKSISLSFTQVFLFSQSYIYCIYENIPNSLFPMTNPNRKSISLIQYRLIAFYWFFHWFWSHGFYGQTNYIGIYIYFRAKSKDMPILT